MSSEQSWIRLREAARTDAVVGASRCGTLDSSTLITDCANLLRVDCASFHRGRERVRARWGRTVRGVRRGWSISLPTRSDQPGRRSACVELRRPRSTCFFPSSIAIHSFHGRRRATFGRCAVSCSSRVRPRDDRLTVASRSGDWSRWHDEEWAAPFRLSTRPSSDIGGEGSIPDS